jgi:glucokinase
VGAVLAVDIGGTRVRTALAHADGTITDRAERLTPTDVGELLTFVRGARHPSIGAAVVGVPGCVDYEAGVLEHAPNLPGGWQDHMTAAALSDALQLTVALANDADLAAVGEAWYGAGLGHRDVAYMTVSTGIGAGIVSGGRLLHGRRSIGEIGHTIIDRAAAGRGADATVEQLGSGTALAKLAAESGLARDGSAVIDQARSGDNAAVCFVEDVVHAASIGAANLTNLFVPDVLVIGGGLGLADELVLDAIRETVRVHGPKRREPVPVLPALLGDDAALCGAAAWRHAGSTAGT